MFSTSFWPPFNTFSFFLFVLFSNYESCNLHIVYWLHFIAFTISKKNGCTHADGVSSHMRCSTGNARVQQWPPWRSYTHTHTTVQWVAEKPYWFCQKCKLKDYSGMSRLAKVVHSSGHRIHGTVSHLLDKWIATDIQKTNRQPIRRVSKWFIFNTLWSPIRCGPISDIWLTERNKLSAGVDLSTEEKKEGWFCQWRMHWKR